MSDKIDFGFDLGDDFKMPPIPPITCGAVIPYKIEKMIAEEEERKAEKKLQHIHLWINTSVAVGAFLISVISLIVSLVR